jgi:hypothetical protein
MSDEVNYREITHKIRNVLRLLKCPRVALDETNIILMRTLVARAEQLKSNKTLADKYQIEELLMSCHPALDGRELSVSISSTISIKTEISDDHLPQSVPPSNSELDKDNSSQVADDTNKSENSENDNQKRIEVFMDFCHKH